MAANEKGIYEMRLIMKTPTKKAAAVTAAGKKKLQNETYPKPAQLSSLKMLIGELLIFGNKERKETWWLFETKLRQYVDLKICGGTI
jgi:hypothetical protein